ncbi:MAG: methyltransferase domain-containing protein [Actinomycetota bacterium]
MPSGDNARSVSNAYDELAELYTKVNLRGLDHPTGDREWLERFASEVASGGRVGDLGCGPGHITALLRELGLDAVGYDITPRLLAEARRRFPHVAVHRADIAALPVPDSTFDGIVARYSLIHMEPASLPQVFGEFARVLKPGCPALVPFYAADTAAEHGAPFDHRVVTAYALHADTIAGQMRDAGFVRFEVGGRGPLEGEREMNHATVLAWRAAD